MNKKFKFASALLATSLALTPITNIIENNLNVNNNIAKAEDKSIKEITYLSYEEVVTIIDEMYNNKIIDLERKQELNSMLLYRGTYGWPYKVTFWDGAVDVHIPGWMVVSGGVIAATTIGALAGSVGLGAVASAGTSIASILNSHHIENIKNHGIVMYFRLEKNKLVCVYSHCEVKDIYVYNHSRIDW